MRLPAAAAALLALLASAGMGRLTLDGDAPWTLPPDDPLVAANARLNAETGGDDLLAAVVVDRRGGAFGLLDDEGVAALDAVRRAVADTPGLVRARSLLTAPLVDSRDGTLTASTPLAPPPSDPEGWAVARRMVHADPFVKQLLSGDGRVASTVGWIDRGSRDAILVRTVDRALRTGSLRPEAAAEARELVSAARLAVALGDAQGPPDAAVARALGASPRVAELGLLEAAEAQAADPAGVALQGLQARLDALELPAGVRVSVAGPRASEDALERETPRAVRLALLAVLATAGLAGARIRRRPAEGLAAVVGGALAFGGVLGLCGWLGLGLHPWLAILALLVAAWTASLVVAGRGQEWRLAPAVAAPAGLVLTFGGGPGVAAAGAGGLALGLALAAAFAGPAEPRPPRRGGWPWLVALLVATVALSGVVSRPLGLDPARMLSPRHPVGAATEALARGTGTAPGAFVLYEGGASRAVARPSSLSAIAALQQALLADEAVAGTASWVDLVAGLHRAVAGPDAGPLPTDPALVEQYLLLFGRPAETRALASADLDLAVVLLRLAPGGGARLAALSDRFPAGDDAATLVGQSVAMARAGRDRSVRAAWGLLAGLAILVGSLARRSAGLAVVAASCGAVALAVAAVAGGSVGVPALLAGGVVAGGSVATLSGASGRVAGAPILALAALAASPVTMFSIVALGVGAGLGAAVVVGILRPGA